MRHIFLSPVSSALLANLVAERTCGIVRVLPLMHTEKYRHMLVVDSENSFNQGIGAIVSMGGEDKSKAHLLARDLISFLEDHYSKLLSNFFFT